MSIMSKLFKEYPRRLTSVEVEILMREAYEHAHGIADHESAVTSPAERYYGLVLKRRSEDTLGLSRMCERMDAFLENDVHALSGLDWLKFKELPTGEMELLLERTAAKNVRKEKAAADFVKQMKDEEAKKANQNLHPPNMPRVMPK